MITQEHTQETLLYPNLSCESCTVQMIQVMGSWPNNYYACSDVSITVDDNLPLDSYNATLSGITTISNSNGIVTTKSLNIESSSLSLTSNSLFAFLIFCVVALIN